MVESKSNGKFNTIINYIYNDRPISYRKVKTMSQSKAEEINQKLMNLKIVRNGKNFGTIYNIENIMDNGCEYFKCYTTLGFTFNANLILNAMSAIKLNSQVVSKVDSDDKVTVLPVGYPDGTEYAKKFSGPKKMHIAIPYVTEAINNRATVSNPNSDEKSEVISITSHSSSDNSFPEENVDGYQYRIQCIQYQRKLGNI